MQLDEQVCLLPTHKILIGLAQPRSAVSVPATFELPQTHSPSASYPREADRATYYEQAKSSHATPTSGTKDRSPMPASIKRAQHVTTVRDTLASWCETVAEAQGVAVPDSRGTGSTVRFLQRWHDATLRADYGLDYATEVLELSRQAWRLLYPSGARRVPCGPCRETVTDEAGGTVRCDGELSAVVRDTDSILPSSIGCRSCGVEIPASQWLTYGRWLQQQAA